MRLITRNLNFLVPELINDSRNVPLFFFLVFSYSSEQQVQVSRSVIPKSTMPRRCLWTKSKTYIYIYSHIHVWKDERKGDKRLVFGIHVFGRIKKKLSNTLTRRAKVREKDGWKGLFLKGPIYLTERCIREKGNDKMRSYSCSYHLKFKYLKFLQSHLFLEMQYERKSIGSLCKDEI